MMTYELSRSRFDDVMQAFRPSRYEVFGNDDPRFTTPMHHALKCRDRFYAALRSGLRWLPEGPQAIVDFGPYPGSLLRLLRLIDATKPAGNADSRASPALRGPGAATSGSASSSAGAP